MQISSWRKLAKEASEKGGVLRPSRSIFYVGKKFRKVTARVIVKEKGFFGKAKDALAISKENDFSRPCEKKLVIFKPF